MEERSLRTGQKHPSSALVSPALYMELESQNQLPVQLPVRVLKIATNSSNKFALKVVLVFHHYVKLVKAQLVKACFFSVFMSFDLKSGLES